MIDTFPTTTPSTVRFSNTYVLAFDFGGSKTAVALFDPNGEILADRSLPNSIDGSPRSAQLIIEAASATGNELIEQLDVQSLRDVIIGAVSPGVILSNRILLAPNVDGWENIALGSQISKGFGGRNVRVANDVKAAAAAESRWGNLADCDPGLYVNLGTGIAVATIVNGQVVQGAHGWAGEVGYNAVKVSQTHQNGRDDHIGLISDSSLKEGVYHSTLETLVGAGALRRQAQQAGLGNLDAESLMASIRTDPLAHRLITSALDVLGSHLASMVHLLDPKRIVVGGGLAGAPKIVFPLLRNSLRSFLGSSIVDEFGDAEGDAVELVSSAFGTRASLYGARLVGLGLFP
jgi:glucokinase